LIALSQFGILPCHAQPKQESGPKTEEEQPPDPPPPSPTQIPPAASLEIYGFAMVDNGYNAGTIDPLWFDVMRPSKLPAFNNEFGRNGNWFAGVRQSRLGFKTYIPIGKHVLKTVIDFDFFGVGVDAGQTTIRLRHAYGEYGQFLGGQTESTFMDLDVFPNILDYWGPNGMVFIRNVQMRWTPWLKGDSNVAISIERPGASADGGAYADRIELQNVRARFRWPDLAGHVRFGNKRGHIQFSGIVRDMKWDDLLPNDVFNLDGGAVGWGAHVSGNLNIGKDVLRLSVVYGRGVQNYMNDAPIDVGIKNNYINSTIPILNPITPIIGVALPVLGTVSFLDHTWSDKFTSSIGYSLVDISNTNGELPTAFRRGQYGIANLLYYPVKPVLMGAEFQWGRRSDFSNRYKYNDYKLQVSFKYSFSFTLERR
jgi:hypothetical protein